MSVRFVCGNCQLTLFRDEFQSYLCAYVTDSTPAKPATTLFPVDRQIVESIVYLAGIPFETDDSKIKIEEIRKALATSTSPDIQSIISQIIPEDQHLNRGRLVMVFVATRMLLEHYFSQNPETEWNKFAGQLCAQVADQAAKDHVFSYMNSMGRFGLFVCFHIEMLCKKGCFELSEELKHGLKLATNGACDI